MILACQLCGGVVEIAVAGWRCYAVCVLLYANCEQASLAATSERQMFGLGPVEMLIVGAIAILLFGNRLPGVARSLGQGIVEFKKGLNDDRNADR